jgi:hypothetical protein
VVGTTKHEAGVARNRVGLVRLYYGERMGKGQLWKANEESTFEAKSAFFSYRGGSQGP